MESTCAARCGASLPHWAQPGCPGRFALGKAEPACLPTMGLAALRCCGATKAGRPSCVSVCHVDAAGSYGWVDKTPWSVEEMEPLTLEGSRGLEETHAAATGEGRRAAAHAAGSTARPYTQGGDTARPASAPGGEG